MREWARQMYLMIYYYWNKSGILKELSKSVEKAFPPDPLWKHDNQPTADCAITYGPSTVCCMRGVTRAKCNEIADDLAQKYPGCVGNWRSNLCDNTSAPDCRSIPK